MHYTLLYLALLCASPSFWTKGSLHGRKTEVTNGAGKIQILRGIDLCRGMVQALYLMIARFAKGQHQLTHRAGFQSVRLPTHNKLYTPPDEDEAVSDRDAKKPSCWDRALYKLIIDGIPQMDQSHLIFIEGNELVDDHGEMTSSLDEAVACSGDAGACEFRCCTALLNCEESRLLNYPGIIHIKLGLSLA